MMPFIRNQIEQALSNPLSREESDNFKSSSFFGNTPKENDMVLFLLIRDKINKTFDKIFLIEYEIESFFDDYDFIGFFNNFISVEKMDD